MRAIIGQVDIELQRTAVLGESVIVIDARAPSIFTIPCF